MEKSLLELLREYVEEVKGKTFITSHDPRQATGFFLREIEFLRRHGIEFYREAINGIWHQRGVR